jgi:hypothetical protein
MATPTTTIARRTDIRMDPSRFDVWTRRRFVAAVAGALTGLIGVPDRDGGLARKKRKRKHRKRRCERLGTRCNPHNDKQLCCGALFCLVVPELGGNRCCKTLHLPCARDADCCGNLLCAGEAGGRTCRTGP